MSSSPSARIHALRVGGTFFFIDYVSELRIPQIVSLGKAYRRAFRRQFRIISVSLVALTCTRSVFGLNRGEEEGGTGKGKGGSGKGKGDFKFY
eukprot:1287694-Amorphochlora_amoeboformis.AAC.2